MNPTTLEILTYWLRHVRRCVIPTPLRNLSVPALAILGRPPSDSDLIAAATMAGMRMWWRGRQHWCQRSEVRS